MSTKISVKDVFNKLQYILANEPPTQGRAGIAGSVEYDNLTISPSLVKENEYSVTVPDFASFTIKKSEGVVSVSPPNGVEGEREVYGEIYTIVQSHVYCSGRHVHTLKLLVDTYWKSLKASRP